MAHGHDIVDSERMMGSAPRFFCFDHDREIGFDDWAETACDDLRAYATGAEEIHGDFKSVDDRVFFLEKDLVRQGSFVEKHHHDHFPGCGSEFFSELASETVGSRLVCFHLALNSHLTYTGPRLRPIVAIVVETTDLQMRSDNVVSCGVQEDTDSLSFVHSIRTSLLVFLCAV